MKKTLIGAFTFVFAFFFLAPTTYAKVMVDKQGTVTVGSNEIVNDDLFIGAQNVEIDGTVNGDVFAGARMVRITGKINGNLHVGTQNFIDNGTVNGNVYLGAQSVTLNGAKISGSLIVGAASVYLDYSSSIGRSLIVGSSDLSNYAAIGRNLVAGAGSVFLDSSVGGEVRLGGGDIRVGPNTKIAKDFYYMTSQKGNNVDIFQSASVAGTIKKVETQVSNEVNITEAKANANKFFNGLKTGLSIISFLGAVLVGLILLKLFPKASLAVSSEVTNSPFKSLGVGFLIAILFLPAVIVLAITGIGLPLAGIIFALFLINLYMTKLVMSLSLGNWLSSKFGWKKVSSYGSFAIGLVVFYILKMIPVLGFFVSLVVAFTGLGALFIFYKSSLNQAK